MDMTGAKGGVSDVAQAKIDAPLHHNLLLAGFRAATVATARLEIADQIQGTNYCNGQTTAQFWLLECSPGSGP